MLLLYVLPLFLTARYARFKYITIIYTVMQPIFPPFAWDNFKRQFRIQRTEDRSRFRPRQSFRLLPDKGFPYDFSDRVISIFNFIVQQVELEVSLIEALIVINVKGIRQNWLDLDSKVNFHH